MNDRDKEAFEKFMGENLPFSYYEYYSCPEIDAWQAACEYKNKQYSDICDARMQTSLNNVKLQAENAKLKDCIKKIAFNYDRPTDMMNSARQVLKELEGEK